MFIGHLKFKSSLFMEEYVIKHFRNVAERLFKILQIIFCFKKVQQAETL